MNLCGICYAFMGYIAAPQIGVGYNAEGMRVTLAQVIAAPQNWVGYIPLRYEQAVIRAVWLKEARVVYVCIRIDGVSTDPHNNPPKPPTQGGFLLPMRWIFNGKRCVYKIKDRRK